MTQKRFVSWAAVSSLPQAKKISLHEQRAINRQHIEKHGGSLVADLEVPGESRDIDLFEEARDRIPAYQQLYDLVKSRSFDVLVCLKRDRLGRTLALAETVAQLCRRAHIVIYETESPPESLDFRDTYDDLLLGAIKSAGAQRELVEIQRRHAMGMMGKFQRGEFLNKIPFGWRAEYDSKGHATIKLDEQAATIIRLALVELFLDKGLGRPSIAEELKQRGYKTATGIEWSAYNVGKLFDMVWRYAGYAEINAYSKHRPYARGKGDFPAIISEDELQRIIETRATRVGARGAVAKTHRFSLMIWCNICNKRMRLQQTFTKRTRKDGTQVSYPHVVAGCRHEPYHSQRFLTCSKVERAVRAFILDLRQEGDLSAHLGDGEEVGTAGIDAQQEGIRGEIEKARNDMLKADDMLMDGKFDYERHSRQVKRIKDRIAQLEHEITLLDDRRRAIQHRGQRRARLSELIESGIDYLNMADERAANAKLRPLMKIWVGKGKVQRIELP